MSKTPINRFSQKATVNTTQKFSEIFISSVYDRFNIFFLLFRLIYLTLGGMFNLGSNYFNPKLDIWYFNPTLDIGHLRYIVQSDAHISSNKWSLRSIMLCGSQQLAYTKQWTQQTCLQESKSHNIPTKAGMNMTKTRFHLKVDAYINI